MQETSLPLLPLIMGVKVTAFPCDSLVLKSGAPCSWAKIQCEAQT